MARISDNFINLQASLSNQRAQTDYATARTQGDGGTIANSYSSAATAPNTRSILKATQDKCLFEGIKTPLLMVKENLKSTYEGVVRMRDIAQEFAVRIKGASDTATLDGTFATFCADKLKEISTILNEQNSSSAPIFGSSSRLPMVVDLSLMPVPAPGDPVGMATTSYFLGESGGLNTTLGENQTMNYGCSADETAIKELLFWLKKGSVVHPDGDVNGNACLALQTMTDGIKFTQNKLALLGAKEGGLFATIDGIEKGFNDKQARNAQDLDTYLAANIAESLIKSSEADQRLQMQNMSKVNRLRTIRNYVQNM